MSGPELKTGSPDSSARVPPVIDRRDAQRGTTLTDDRGSDATKGGGK